MEPGKFTPEEIEKMLQSIDGINRAETLPFFYTRLQAKMEKVPSSSNAFWLLVTKPAVSLVTLSLLIILNIAAISQYIKTATQQTVSPQSSGIEKFAQEYDLNGSSIYNDKTTR